MRARPRPKALIRAVEPETPADDAGFTPGCYITHVDGQPVRDIIDWRWLTAEDEITVRYIDTDGEAGEVDLWREEGESWGFEFEGAVFDEVIQCRNACIFCFMTQLPDDARPTLTLRDDDFRLSFLQGTFVTFTNLTPEDEARIIEQHISPLRYSLHAVSEDVRRHMIGKHALAGIEAAQRLLDAGIELHAQIVLMPGENDGEELRKSLQWCWEHPGILGVAIVPLGYTKHQTKFESSFNTRDAARGVIKLVEPFQARAIAAGRPDAWVFASDEFYRNAYPDTLLDHLPPSEFYGSFEMFEDGIGIVRSFIDDWENCVPAQVACAQALRAAGVCVPFVAGYAQREFFGPLVDASPLAGLLEPLYVKNDYFGGNVDVTGLLCGCDIGPAIAAWRAQAEAAGKRVAFAALPKVILNADSLTLDDLTVEDIERAATCSVRVVSCNASEFLLQIAAAVQA